MPQLTISIVVPTFNRAPFVVELLNRLSDQTRHDFEVIVVVDGSIDGTAEQCRALRLPYNLNVVEQENQGRSIARNRGAQESQAQLLLFLDDDLRPEPDLLERHLEFHGHRSGGVLVGSVPFVGDEPQTDVQGFRKMIDNRWSEGLPKELAIINMREPYMTAAQFSVSKLVFDHVGGFESNCNWGEDRLLAYRMRDACVMIYFDPLCIAHHHDPMNFQRMVFRLRQEHKIWDMFDDVAPELHAVPKSRMQVLKRLIYKPFASYSFFNSVDSGTWTFLPKNLRYRLYEWILNAWVYQYPEKPLLNE